MDASISVRALNSDQKPLKKKMEAARKACSLAGVPEPKEVSNFFSHEDESGREGIEVGTLKKSIHDMTDTYVLFLKDIPAGADKLHIHLNWD